MNPEVASNGVRKMPKQKPGRSKQDYATPEDEKARALGWHVDWEGPYPGVACSEACWKLSNDEWERRRPARHAAWTKRKEGSGS